MEYGIKDRQGNVIPVTSEQNRMLEFLYRTSGGNIALKGLTAPIISRLAGRFCDSFLSAKLIPAFIEKAGIDLTEYESGYFKSFNEFFTRKIKTDARPVNMNPHAFISPCDSKLTVYKINKDSRFRIKGADYSTASFLRCKTLAERYRNGWFMIFRLDVSDYHRYIYVDNGYKSKNIHINGVYHTVNPVALEKANIYKENAREYTVLHTENFGDIIHAEVGAMLVGKISNHHQKYKFSRGEEKGMFEYGGSTVVLIIPSGTVIPDKDILKNTNDGFETIVKMGEKIGSKKG